MSGTKWGKLPCKLTELCIDLTLNCGQSFRWKELGCGSWIGVFAGRLWKLKQDEKHLMYQILNPEAAVTGRKAVAELVTEYFQLDTKLEDLYKEWSTADENFAAVALTYGGVRMLRQDPVENVFSFICSSNNNIARISSMVEKLCQTYGDKMMDYEGCSYHDFPRVEFLAASSVESKLREMGFGYRAKFIHQSAVKIVQNGGKEWLFSLRDKPYEEAKAALMSLPGIGAKVADCICLMSLNHSGAIPVDTHVFQIAKASYLPHLANLKSVTDKAYLEISNYFRVKFGPYAGWAHSVLFTADLRHLKPKQRELAERHDEEIAGRKSRKRRKLN